eukprot:gb/GFBE01060853.1/.p1 GENE.gb/GFBE01060853.1/~~gb/GFBE01060853.1/.p1  ORF type:complete len:242 (+),score=59.62 gb/GFBE01060853.1/:1-726(+)
MASRLRSNELLGGESIRAALEPLLEQASDPLRPGSDGTDGLAAAREEARLVLQILGYVEALSSTEEIRRTFSQSPLEVHLTEVLLAGGAAGELDMPALLHSLQAAASVGSIWAPHWLAEVESLRQAVVEDFRGRSGEDDNVASACASSSNVLAQLSELAAEMAVAAGGGGGDAREAVEEIPAEEIPGLVEEASDDAPQLPPRLRRMLDGLRAMSEVTGDSQEQQERDIVQMFLAKPRKSKL